jgi:hypothetical protein
MSVSFTFPGATGRDIVASVSVVVSFAGLACVVGFSVSLFDTQGNFEDHDCSHVMSYIYEYLLLSLQSEKIFAISELNWLTVPDLDRTPTEKCRFYFW